MKKMKTYQVGQTTSTSASTSENHSTPAEDPTEWFAKMQRMEGRRRNDRDSSVGIRPGWTWAWVLIWIATAHGIRPNNAPEGRRRTSAPEDGTRLCGKPYFEGPRDTCTKLVSLRRTRRPNLTGPQDAALASCNQKWSHGRRLWKCKTCCLCFCNDVQAGSPEMRVPLGVTHARRSARGLQDLQRDWVTQPALPSAVHTPQFLWKRVAQLMARQIRMQRWQRTTPRPGGCLTNASRP